jgi:hypothetical protein
MFASGSTLTQFHHVRIDRARIRKRFISPYRIENHVVGERSIRVLQEVREQVVLGRRELQPSPRASPRDAPDPPVSAK